MFENIFLRIKYYSLDKQMIAVFYNEQMHISFRQTHSNVLKNARGMQFQSIQRGQISKISRDCTQPWRVLPDRFYHYVEYFLYLILTLDWVQQWGRGGGIHAPKKQDREVGRIFFFFYFFTFCHCFFFYCIQRAYETLKQNLVKFRHS